jgi:hypothetical protein
MMGRCWFLSEHDIEPWIILLPAIDESTCISLISVEFDRSVDRPTSPDGMNLPFPSLQPEPSYKASRQHGVQFHSACMEAKLSRGLVMAAGKEPPAGASSTAPRVDYNASPCEHAQTLKMCLLDAIRGLYGPMDPVSATSSSAPSGTTSPSSLGAGASRRRA